MSKLVQYVGILHVMKDHIKETWTQFWANLPNSSVNCGGDGGDSHDEKDINFRSRIKDKLNMLKQQSIRAIDSSSSDQEDYSHLTRPKTRKELMQISAAVMGIEFSYAAETAFVSPLLLNIGLRHRHMTLIWCLSPLLGFFVTPLLGSLSDGCRSQLGRRRPFIILLSIGIILGLILVPNGKTIGRMLGDTYIDDKPPDLKAPSELATHLVLAPHLTSSQSTLSTRTTGSPETPRVFSNNEAVEKFRERFNNSEESSGNGATVYAENTLGENEKPLYKSQSKYMPIEYAHGFRAWNSLTYKDRDLEEKEFFKSLARKDKREKINQEELQRLVLQATQEENNETGERSGEDSSSGGRENSRGAVEKNNNTTNKETTLFEMTINNRSSKDETASDKHMFRWKRLGTSVGDQTKNGASNFDSGSEDAVKSHPWGLVFTVIGTVLLDFDADACQSPSRAYMLDITISEDHAKGLSTFTIMAGLGGSIGYFLGALDWESTFLGEMFGGHVRAVFTLVLFIFIACVIATVRSFREIPMDRLWANKGGGLSSTTCDQLSIVTEHKPKRNLSIPDKNYAKLDNEIDSANATETPTAVQKSYGAIQETSFNSTSAQQAEKSAISGSAEQAPTFREYVKTIIQLPKSLQWLCVTNFFCWMSLVCYSLYFTDFVGEAVFGGDPTAPQGSLEKKLYDEGVRFGCWGMSLYSLSCALYSICIESLVNRFGARRVYIYGQLVYSIGMVLMAVARHPVGVIVFSWTAGIMYATLFTMPYLLVARYHAAETFDVDVDDLMEKPLQRRGLGTDVAIVSSMVFLAQITQAITLGTIVTAVGSTTAIVCAASVFAMCGAVCATKVLYLDL